MFTRWYKSGGGAPHGGDNDEKEGITAIDKRTRGGFNHLGFSQLHSNVVFDNVLDIVAKAPLGVQLP